MTLGHWNFTFQMNDGGDVPAALQDVSYTLVEHYANDLNIARFHCDLHIHFREEYALNDDLAAGLMTKWGNRQFEIELALYNNWAVFLAHELVHVKQCLRKQVNEKWTHWQGLPVSPSHEYHELPWEAEALDLQWKLAKNFYTDGWVDS